MTSEERNRKQKELVEELGRHFDKEGYQPIAGRILGLLMVMDKEQYTFDEIVEELQISKSSASNALRNLEIRESIEYITLPGDRKRYFQVKQTDASSMTDSIVKKMTAMLDMTDAVIELKSNKDSRNAVFMKEIMKQMDVLLKHLKKAMEGNC